MATHQGVAVKYEKLTFTPTRVIEIERTGEPGEEPWPNVVLKPGREVTFGPFRELFYDDDWYIDDKRIHRVLHCDVERVYAQLSMESDLAALNSAPCDTRHPPENHEMTPLGDYCVKCRRTAAYVLATGRRAGKSATVADAAAKHTAKRDAVLRQYAIDTEKQLAPESFPDRVMRVAREAGYEPTGGEHVGTNGWIVLFDRPTLGIQSRGVCIGDGKDDNFTLSVLRKFAGPDNQPEAVRARKAQARTERSMVPYLEVGGVRAVADALVPKGALNYRCNGYQFLHPTDYAKLKAELDRFPRVPVEKPPRGPTHRDDMVATIIAEQVAAGGVDTEGTRAQAERWCAWLCECVCEGMRATTEQSALRARPSDVVWWETRWRGKPLGRP